MSSALHRIIRDRGREEERDIGGCSLHGRSLNLKAIKPLTSTCHDPYTAESEDSPLSAQEYELSLLTEGRQIYAEFTTAMVR